jgi:hypothetical protein
VPYFDGLASERAGDFSGPFSCFKFSLQIDAEDLDVTKTQVEAALVDIADNLIRRFGGEIVEHYIEK